MVKSDIFLFLLFSFLLIIFLLVFISFAAINPDFAIPNGPHYNTTELRNMGFFDNERYLISALVQSLAATIALVITLSLVAVQLAAQSYSARVIEVYKNNPDMWILLSIYIVVIFYGLGLLKVIDIGVAGINMEFAIFAAYFLGFFAFVCLVPYMLKTLDLLKPSTVIKLLAADITKEKILESVEEDGEITEKDPIQPITDMINAALERNDYETVRNGLEGIKKRANEIIKNNYIDEDEEMKCSDHLIEHIERIGLQAIKKENEFSTISSIKTIEEMGTNAAEINLERTTLRTVRTLKILANAAFAKNYVFSTREIVRSVKEIGIKSSKQELKRVPVECVLTLNEIGMKQVDLKREWDIGITVNAIINICLKDRNCVYISTNTFEKFGIKAIELKLDEAVLSISEGLKLLGIMRGKTANEERQVLNIVIALGKIGEDTIDKDIPYLTDKITEDIGSVGISVVENELKWSTETTIRVLGVMRKKCFEKEMEDNVKAIDDFITEILNKSIKKGWNMSLIIKMLQNENDEDEFSNDENTQPYYHHLRLQISPAHPNDSCGKI